MTITYLFGETPYLKGSAALNKRDYKTLKKIADQSRTIPDTYLLETLGYMINYLDYATQTKGSRLDPK